MTQIGFIGLGAIGRPIANCLARGGEPLSVFDPRPEAAYGMPGNVARLRSAMAVGNAAGAGSDDADVTTVVRPMEAVANIELRARRAT